MFNVNEAPFVQVSPVTEQVPALQVAAAQLEPVVAYSQETTPEPPVSAKVVLIE
jgi:hypothetical protein